MEHTKPAAKMSAPKRHSAKHEIDSVTIRKADNGGYSVDHHFRQKHDGKGRMNEVGAYKPSENHVFTSFTDMHGSLPKVFGEKAAAAHEQEGQEEVPTAKGA